MAEKKAAKKTEKKKDLVLVETPAERNLEAETEEFFKKAEEAKKEPSGHLHGMAGGVSFLCPQCGKGKIRRTLHERIIATKYVCSNCGFEGPN